MCISMFEISLLVFFHSAFIFSKCDDKILEFFNNDPIDSFNIISLVRSDNLDPKSNEREFACGSNSSPATVTHLYPCFDS